MSDWEVAPDSGSDWAVVDEEPEEGGPESFLDPKKFKPSPTRRKFNNTGSMEQVRADLAGDKRDVGDLASGPINSAIDRFTLGGLTGALKLDQAAADNPVARFVDEHLPAIGKRGGAVAGRALEDIQRYRQEAPTLSQYTDAPGYMGGGARVFAGAVERVLPRVANPVAQAARATLGAGITGGAAAGAESFARGDDPVEIAREAGRGAAGGTLIGAPASVFSGLLGAGARAVLNSKGAKAREYLSERGQPLTAPDTSDAAIGAAAQRADEAVKSRLQAYKGEVASGPYTEAIDAIPENLANQAVNVTPIYRELAQAAGDPANLQVADKLNTLVKMLGDRPIMTQQELNGLRQSLSRVAGVGETTSARSAPLRRAYESVKALVDQGPYAEANQRFAGGMRDFGESLDMVGLRSTTSPDEPIAGNFRVKAQRAGQNTVTAGGDTESLNIEGFKAKHPELANAIDEPEIIRKQGDLGFHLGPQGHGGLIDRLASSLPLPAMAAAYAMGHGWKGAAAAALMAAYENRSPLAGRVLYGPAQNAQIASQALLGDVPVFGAPGRDVIQEKR